VTQPHPTVLKGQRRNVTDTVHLKMSTVKVFLLLFSLELSQGTVLLCHNNGNGRFKMELAKR